MEWIFVDKCTSSEALRIGPCEWWKEQEPIKLYSDWGSGEWFKLNLVFSIWKSVGSKMG